MILTLSDWFGTISRREYAKLPHALREARDRARAWGRPVFVSGPTKVWTVLPSKQITVRRR